MTHETNEQFLQALEKNEYKSISVSYTVWKNGWWRAGTEIKLRYSHLPAGRVLESRNCDDTDITRAFATLKEAQAFARQIKSTYKKIQNEAAELAR